MLVGIEEGSSPLVDLKSSVGERIVVGDSIGTVIIEEGRRVIILDEVSVEERVSVHRKTYRSPIATTLCIGNVSKAPRKG